MWAWIMLQTDSPADRAPQPIGCPLIPSHAGCDSVFCGQGDTVAAPGMVKGAGWS